MELNSDFSKSVVVRPSDNTWVPSPMKGVDRMMLDRVGDEVARATSIVRYAPGSRFSAHTHDGGEEFVVLDGVFSDEHGDFPEGAYIRNPPTTSHTPGSEPGCVIFVKLWQMQPDDRTQVMIDTNKIDVVNSGDGVSLTPLFKDDFENVRVVHLDKGTRFEVTADGGAEVLVLAGSVRLDSELLEKWSWLRRADGQPTALTAGNDGAKLWVKQGHLTHIQTPG